MIEMSLSIPLDDDHFFRRECPLCGREFKVLLEEDELTNLAQSGLDSYMLETEMDTSEEDDADSEFTCPYCGQQASKDSWWTQEQLAYVRVIAENIMARIINEQLIKPMKKMSSRHRSGLVSLQFKGKEMEQKEPWISPEENDMEVFDLPCCHRKIKVEENWDSTVYCFFCGFPHKPNHTE